MKIRAYAKINLGLDVIRRKENGYHDLKMVMVPIDFYDVLDIEIASKMSFECNREYVTSNPNNTVIAAIEYLRNKYGFKENFKIYLDKHIPTKAGLAGGSTDGAAAIIALNKLLKLNMSHEEMKEAALAIGADVYFCLVGKPSIVEGIGDIVTPFECKLDLDILLVKPKKGVVTKEAFKLINIDKAYHPDIDLMAKSLKDNDYETFIKTLGNSLEEPSFRLVKEISDIKEEMLEMGFDGALMSGSGSTVFGVSNDKNVILKAQEKFKNDGYFVRRVKIVK